MSDETKPGGIRLVVGGLVVAGAVGVATWVWMSSSAEPSTGPGRAPDATAFAPYDVGTTPSQPDDTSTAKQNAVKKPDGADETQGGSARPTEQPPPPARRARAPETASPGTPPSNRPGSAPSPDTSDVPTATLDKDDVREAIRAFSPVAKQCYERTLEDFPEAEGKITLTFDVIADRGEGRVELAKLGNDTTLFDENLHDCLMRGVGDVSFPAPEGTGKTRVTYPFQFRNSHGDAY